jgi:hypothetical protein
MPADLSNPCLNPVLELWLAGLHPLGAIDSRSMDPAGSPLVILLRQRPTTEGFAQRAAMGATPGTF